MFGLIASIAGGLISSRSQKNAQQSQNKYNDPASIRSRYEAAGFNPLLGINNPSALQQPVNHVPYMGQAIANAGALFDQNRHREKELEMRQTQLEMQNKRLQKTLTGSLLRPSVPGIYQRRKQPSGRTSMLGNPNADRRLPLPPETITGADGTEKLNPGFANEDQMDGEIERLKIERGGAPRDTSIHMRQHPLFGPVYVERPGMGQRLEDDQGDLWSNVSSLPYVVSDMANNAMRREYDPEEQKWKDTKDTPLSPQELWEDAKIRRKLSAAERRAKERKRIEEWNEKRKKRFKKKVVQ